MVRIVRKAVARVDRPTWKPLERAIGRELAPEFMFMGVEAGAYYYKHIETRRYIVVDRRGHVLHIDEARA